MKVTKALLGDDKLPATMTTEEKEDIQELAYNIILLYLSDKVMQYVKKEKTDAGVWLKL